MPSRIRHRGLQRPRSARAVSAAAIPLRDSTIDVVPAIEQPGRHHVERLEILMHETKGLLEIGQHRAGKLVYQERPVRIQYRVGFAQDPVA
jgi:hypothetical protein